VDHEQEIRRLQKSIRSIEIQILEHEVKWAEYSKNPNAYDNQNLLISAPTDEIRQQIIQGRLNKLRREIKGFYSELAKLRMRLIQIRGT